MTLRSSGYDLSAERANGHFTTTTRSCQLGTLASHISKWLRFCTCRLCLRRARLGESQPSAAVLSGLQQHDVRAFLCARRYGNALFCHPDVFRDHGADARPRSAAYARQMPGTSGLLRAVPVASHEGALALVTLLKLANLSCSQCSWCTWWPPESQGVTNPPRHPIWRPTCKCCNHSLHAASSG